MKVRDWRVALDIIAKYTPEGEDSSYIFDADYQVILTHLTPQDLPEMSQDGKKLAELGFHIQSGVWARFV